MITKRDIFAALGAENESHFMAGMLVGIGVGAIVGSAVAMLFAPRTGEQMRHLIGEKVPDLVDKAKTRIGLGRDGGHSRDEATSGQIR
jgi:gas vesicle protein